MQPSPRMTVLKALGEPRGGGVSLTAIALRRVISERASDELLKELGLALLVQTASVTALTPKDAAAVLRVARVAHPKGEEWRLDWSRIEPKDDGPPDWVSEMSETLGGAEHLESRVLALLARSESSVVSTVSASYRLVGWKTSLPYPKKRQLTEGASVSAEMVVWEVDGLPRLSMLVAPRPRKRTEWTITAFGEVTGGWTVDTVATTERELWHDLTTHLLVRRDA